MRKDAKMPKFLKLLLSLLAISLLTSFSYGADCTAVVRAVKGKAKLIDEEGKAIKVQIGQTLKPGTSIETDGKASVDLAFSDNGPTVRLEDNTVFKIVKLDLDQTTKRATTIVALELGGIHGHIPQQAPGSLFILKTPEIDINITGDEFAATAWGEIQAVKGTAEITIGKDKIEVTEGHQLDVGTKEIGPILAQK
jgi:hypothetical protein